MGEQTPYTNDGKRSDVKDIEPVSDKFSKTNLPAEDANKFFEFMSISDIPNINWANKNHIEKVDWLREQIKLVIEKVFTLQEENLLTRQAKFKTHEHLTEARFHLGFELQRIKEAKA